MSGPRHFLLAEDLLKQAVDDEVGSANEQYHLAAAQVHATLAVAAALIDVAANAHADEWGEATE